MDAPVYLIRLPDDQNPTRHLFFWADPRPYCTNAVTEGVEFFGLETRQDKWQLSINVVPHCLGQSKRSPRQFKAFRSELDVPNSWEILDGVAEVWSTWEAFSRRK